LSELLPVSLVDQPQFTSTGPRQSYFSSSCRCFCFSFGWKPRSGDNVVQRQSERERERTGEERQRVYVNSTFPFYLRVLASSPGLSINPGALMCSSLAAAKCAKRYTVVPETGENGRNRSFRLLGRSARSQERRKLSVMVVKAHTLLLWCSFLRAKADREGRRRPNGCCGELISSPHPKGRHYFRGRPRSERQPWNGAFCDEGVIGVACLPWAGD
jgi:hypothetical protein